VSANGKTLYSGDGAGNVKVWDLKTGKVTRERDVASKRIGRLAVNPEETALAILSFDGTVHLWDLRPGGKLSLLNRPGWDARGLSMSSDGKLLAFTGVLNRGKHVLYVWALDPLKETRTLPSEEDRCNRVQFLEGTHTLVTDGKLATLELWDVDRGVRTGTLQGPPKVSWGSLAHTAEGNLLAAGGDQGELVLWDLATKKLVHSSRPHTSWITKTTFSKDGKRLITGSHDFGDDDRPGHAKVKVWAIRR
jgi:WD40 repeat protein